MSEKEIFKEKLVLLVLGFVLTSVLGGVVGSYFQYQSWENQWAIKRFDSQAERKTNTFKEISSLLDKRLFRSRQFLWALQGRFSDEQVVVRLGRYREIIELWNESLNSNLALIEIYFGKDLRNQFENEIGNSLITKGAAIEALYRKYQQNEDLDIKSVDESLNAINISIYHFNLSMLKSIEGDYKK